MAGFGSLLPLILAGAVLGFYADYIPVEVARIVCVVVGIALVSGAPYMGGSRIWGNKGMRGANAEFATLALKVPIVRIDRKSRRPSSVESDIFRRA